MPQASLLSYFSQPVTPAVSVQPTVPRNGHAEQGIDVPSRVASLRSQALSEVARKQASLSATQRDNHVPQAKQPKVLTSVIEAREESKDVASRNAASPASQTEWLLSSQVPHLPEAAISTVSEEHLPSIRRLTTTTLPVRYSEAFFTTTVTDPTAKQLSRVVLYKSEPVGWIRCRSEPCSPNNSFIAQPNPPLSQIYIQALALLSPYRGLGLATLLLNTILSSETALAEHTVCIYAHVWEKNEDALDWYAKRGFKRVMLVEHYYRKLRPSGAWVVRREMQST